MRMHWSRLPLLLALLLAAACGDATGPGNPGGGPGPTPLPPGTPPDTLPIIGQGTVTERYTAEVAERGGWVYTSTWGQRNPGADGLGDVVYVWNATGATPVLADSLRILGTVTTGDVQISDDGKLLMVATEFTGGSVVLYDRTDPAHPVQLARFTSPETNPGVHTAKFGRVKGHLYAFLSIDPFTKAHQPARLVILDLADPSNPRQIYAEVMGNPYVHDVFVRDGILFTALWNDGLGIWDIGGAGRGGSPAHPVRLGTAHTVGVGDLPSVHNVWWFHDPSTGSKRYAFVGEENYPAVIGSSATGDIHVVDVSDFANPKEVAYFHVDGAGTHNFSMDEEHGVLYAAYYNGGMRALAVRGDLSSCDASARAADGRCDLRSMGREVGVALDDVPEAYVWGVRYDAGKVYVSDMDHGLFVVDASALGR